MLCLAQSNKNTAIHYALKIKMWGQRMKASEMRNEMVYKCLEYNSLSNISRVQIKRVCLYFYLSVKI